MLLLKVMIIKMIVFLQAEDGIRYSQDSQGLGDVYKCPGWHSGSVIEVGHGVA